MLYKEDGKGSRSTKVKTNKYSDEKYNIKKTVFQQRHSRQPVHTLLEDLTGATFSGFRPAMFKNTIERILAFAALNYIHYTGQAVQNRQPKTFSRLTNPRDDDIADDPDGAKYWWQAECNEIMVEKRT